MTDIQKRAREQADKILATFWTNLLSSERGYIMRDVIAIEIAKAEENGRDIGRAIGWGAAKNDTSRLFQLDGRTHFERDGCDPPTWHGPTGE